MVFEKFIFYIINNYRKSKQKMHFLSEMSMRKFLRKILETCEVEYLYESSE